MPRDGGFVRTAVRVVRREREPTAHLFDRNPNLSPPPWLDFVADGGALAAEFLGFRDRSPTPLELPRGDGHPVLVIPALFSSDYLIRGFRETLDRLGYEVGGWGAGINLGPTPAAWLAAEQRLFPMAERSGCKVALVGHRLG